MFLNRKYLLVLQKIVIFYIIYTSDSTVITKLDKLVESNKSPRRKLKEEHRLHNVELSGKTFETHKHLISFRSNITTKEMSKNKKEAASERFRKIKTTGK